MMKHEHTPGCEMWDSHSGVGEDSSLLGCFIVSDDQ